ncbi:MAG: hypothetical protein LBJ32_02095 [Oscillospiraceae bacterium]|jgi:hypothetical protein|nr:hypothetical protein [Oscillospiraceae bacterium]
MLTENIKKIIKEMLSNLSNINLKQKVFLEIQDLFKKNKKFLSKTFAVSLAILSLTHIMQNFINVEATKVKQIYSKSKHNSKKKIPKNQIKCFFRLIALIVPIVSLFLKLKLKSAGSETEFPLDDPTNPLDAPTNPLDDPTNPSTFPKTEIEIPLKSEKVTPPNPSGVPTNPSTFPKTEIEIPLNLEQIEKNPSITSFFTHLSSDEGGLIMDLTQLQAYLSTNSFEGQLTKQFIDLANLNLLKDPSIILLLKNMEDEISMLIKALYHPLEDLLTNLFENMSSSELVSLLINFSIDELNNFFRYGEVKVTINFQQNPLEESLMNLSLELSEKLVKKLFKYLPEDKKKALEEKFPRLYFFNRPPYEKTLLGPSLLSELIKKNQTRKFFPTNKKRIIILSFLNKKGNLIKKLFEERFSYYKTKILEDKRCYLKSIECINNSEYVVKTIEFFNMNSIIITDLLPFLWEYINNAQSFDIALIIFDPTHDINHIYEQISIWLRFLKTCKSQNIKAIITFIKQTNPNTFFCSIRWKNYNSYYVMKENVKSAKKRIEEMRVKLGIESIRIFKHKDNCFFDDSVCDDMTELKSKIDSFAIGQDAQK